MKMHVVSNDGSGIDDVASGAHSRADRLDDCVSARRRALVRTTARERVV